MDLTCPRCGSPQKFSLRKRIVSDELHERYIRCTICRWEKIVISDHPDRIHNQEELRKLKLRVLRDPALQEVIRRKVKKLRNV